MKANWTPNNDPDAEYHSHVAEYNGKRLEVFSDRNETRWSYCVNEEILGDEDTKQLAMREAELAASAEAK